MITCARCESTYEDDATYCNVCKTAIKNDNSHYLVDQQLFKTTLLARKKHTLNLIYSLGTIAVFFPFFSITHYFPTYIYGSQKIAWILLITALATGGIVGIRTKKSWANLPSLILVGLLLPIIPVGTFSAALVLFFWIKQKE